MIKVTSITVCRNDKEGLELTLKSALIQNFKGLEIVVVDGNSEDGTKEILPSYKQMFEEKGIPFQFISEKDTGIYNAMNKGIKMANGEWLIFMNARDKFANKNVLKDFFSNKDFDKWDVLYGDWWKAFPNGKKKYISGEPMDVLEKRMPSSHQAFFFRREQMAERNYDEQFRMSADFEWIVNAYTSGKKFLYQPIAVCEFDMTGTSNVNIYQTYCNVFDIRRKYKLTKDSNLVQNIKKFVWRIIGYLQSIKMNKYRK